MKIKITRKFSSRRLGRICEEGEEIEADPDWCQSIAKQGFGKITDFTSPLQKNKNILKLKGTQIELIKKKGDKVFLTGHRGYLGSYILEALSQDYDVVGFDLKDGDDILDLDQLQVKMGGCRVVIHGAGIPHPSPQYDFTDYFTSNVMGTLNVCRAAVKSRAWRVVYLSSGAVYGWDTIGKFWPLYLPIDESHPLLTATKKFKGKLCGYAQSKVLAEQVLAWYGTNRFQVLSLRLGPARPQSKFFQFNQRSTLAQREQTLWVNVEPETVARAVRLAIEVNLKIGFEAFNVVEKHTHPDVDLNDYLKQYYPDVPLKEGWQSPQNLLSIEKAERILGL